MIWYNTNKTQNLFKTTDQTETETGTGPVQALF